MHYGHLPLCEKGQNAEELKGKKKSMQKNGIKMTDII
jgi:hypothetical protein